MRRYVKLLLWCEFKQLLICEHLTGLDKIEYLQAHENRDIYHKSFYIIEQYFGNEEEDTRVAPVAGSQQYEFNPQNLPNDAFNF